MTAPLILVDGSSYFYRAFHALPPLTNSKGQPTGAIYGVTNMIKKLVKEYQPERLAVIFDAKGKTFRDDWYPEYKANRSPTPPELSIQFEPLIELLEAMGYPLLIVDGVEADDVIGTLARMAVAQNIPVVISTGDKDMAQLVNHQITLINTMSNTILDWDGVKQKFGVTPEQMIDYLTLMGDSVDNIPGVIKCGPKTAAKWLLEYGSLDRLIENAHLITGKIGDNLREFIPKAALTRRLVSIKKDVALPVTLNELQCTSPNQKKLIELIRTLEFKTWLKELLNQEEAPTDADEAPKEVASYHIITTSNQLDEWVKALEQCTQFCFDVTTTSLDMMEAEIVGVSLSIDLNTAAYIPLKHTDGTPQLHQEEVFERLKPIFEHPNIGKIGHNLKYDDCVLKNHGIHLQGIQYDTMLESYVLNSSASKHDIETLALKYLGRKTIPFEDIAGKGAKQLRFDAIPVEKAALYAGEAAEVTLKLHHILYPMLNPALHHVFHDIEMPLLRVLGDMERQGVLIDADCLQRHGTRLKERIIALEEEATLLAGRVFNLNSPKQLQELLFDDLKLPVITKTPTGQPSTAESVLQELAFDFRLPAVILEYRSLTKLVSTYIDALPKKINPKTHRVHTCYNQAVAATGRLSSSEPNLQNIPARNEEGRLIRTAFIAPEGRVILAADYSQIELRIMAHLSGDERLLYAFSQGLDIHTATASELFHTPLEAVTHEQRRKVKAVNFGLIYGMSAFGLSKQLGIERQEAQHYIDIYFQRYPKVLEYMERTRQQAHEQGYVETLFGRRLYLPEINVSNIVRQKAAERMAINAPMQGTAADIIKKAMLSISEWQKEQTTPQAVMIMQVHDELVFEVSQDSVDRCKEKIRHIMENTVELSVPILVSIGVGSNWDAAH